MSDHILYKEQTLSTAAAELDRLAGIMADVTRQLDAVDTSAEWWEHVKSYGGDSAVGQVRALRRTSESLDRRSTQLAGSVRRSVENFDQVEFDVTRLCQIDGPGSQPLYLKEISAAAAGGGSAGGESDNDDFWKFIWKAVLGNIWSGMAETAGGSIGLWGDMLGKTDTFLDFFADVMEKAGLAGKNPIGDYGPVVSIFASLLGNLQEYISSGGTMSAERAVGEFAVETMTDGVVSAAIGKVIEVLAPVSPKVAIVVAAIGAIYELMFGDTVAEKVSDGVFGTTATGGSGNSFNGGGGSTGGKGSSRSFGGSGGGGGSAW